MTEETIALDSRVIVCPCGGKHFEIGISKGVDGNTHSLWLTCAKCHASRCMRKIMKQIEHQGEDWA